MNDDRWRIAVVDSCKPIIYQSTCIRITHLLLHGNTSQGSSKQYTKGTFRARKVLQQHTHPIKHYTNHNIKRLQLPPIIHIQFIYSLFIRPIAISGASIHPVILQNPFTVLLGHISTDNITQSAKCSSLSKTCTRPSKRKK